MERGALGIKDETPPSTLSSYFRLQCVMSLYLSKHHADIWRFAFNGGVQSRRSLVSFGCRTVLNDRVRRRYHLDEQTTKYPHIRPSTANIHPNPPGPLSKLPIRNPSINKSPTQTTQSNHNSDAALPPT